MNASILFFVGIVQCILFLGHFVVFKSVVFFGDITGRALTTTRLSFLALSLFFIIGSLITAQGFSIAGRIVYTSASVWLGVLFWLFSIAIIGSIIWFVIQYFSPTLTSSSFKHTYGIILLLIAFAVNICGIFNSNRLVVTNYEVRLSNLPDSWNGKHIVMLADTHFGNIWNVKASKKVVELINSQNPEAVLIAGDFFDGPVINFDEVTAPWSEVRSTHGIFFATGNHEEYRDKKVYIDSLQKNKVTVLQNETRTIDGLVIAGINYSDSSNAVSQGEILSSLIDQSGSSSNPVILIKHVPQLLEIAEENGVDLQVSGHTHHGQMWPMSLITKRIFKGYDYGLKDFNGMQVLTTSGAGSWGPPQRIGTNSEIVNITLLKK